MLKHSRNSYKETINTVGNLINILFLLQTVDQLEREKNDSKWETSKVDFNDLDLLFIKACLFRLERICAWLMKHISFSAANTRKDMAT